MTPINFSDLPGDVRMARRAAIEDLGCEVVSYNGSTITVKVPNTPGIMPRLEATAPWAGFRVTLHSYFFPRQHPDGERWGWGTRAYPGDGWERFEVLEALP